MYYNHDLDRERWYSYGRDRGFFDRMGDEIRSWFGNDDAERRRHLDEIEMRRFGTEGRHFGETRGTSGRFMHHDEEERYLRWLRDNSPRHTSQYGQEMYSSYDLPELERRREIERRELERMMRMGYSSMPRREELSDWRTRENLGYGREHTSGMYSSEYMPRQDIMGSGRREFGHEFQSGSSMYGSPLNREMNREYLGREINREYLGRDEEFRLGGNTGMFHGRGPKNWKRNDERIKEDINERLTYHPEIDATEIEVVVALGEVTLKGTVDHRFMKRLAEDIVDHVSGVRDVHNELRVTQNMFGNLPTTTGSSSEKVPAGTRPGSVR